MIFQYSSSILPPPTFPLQFQFDGSVVWFGSNHGSVYPSKVPNWNQTAPELYPNWTNGSVQFGMVPVQFMVQTGSHLNHDIPIHHGFIIFFWHSFHIWNLAEILVEWGRDNTDEKWNLPCFCLPALPWNPLRVLGCIIHHWKGIHEEITAPL